MLMLILKFGNPMLKYMPVDIDGAVQRREDNGKSFPVSRLRVWVRKFNQQYGPEHCRDEDKGIFINLIKDVWLFEATISLTSFDLIFKNQIMNENQTDKQTFTILQTNLLMRMTILVTPHKISDTVLSCLSATLLLQ